MARPKTGYRIADGTRVPGVTTITGRYKDAGGLIHWAWKCGVDGEDYRQTRDQAATAGTVAHDMIEASLKEQPYQPPPGTAGDVLDAATRAHTAFRDWQDQYALDLVQTEVPLVSEAHRFGGTPDAIGWIRGERLILFDWKTSRGVYGDYVVQLGAYQVLWEEHHPDQHLSGAHLLRFDKTTANFTHHSWSRETLELGAQAFLLMRQLYDLDKPLKAAAA